jgi:hypothetical protein
MHSVALGAGERSGSGSSLYYSFNQGLTHFLVFSAEAYTYNSGPEFLAAQLAFMTADLAAVDRSTTPWIVALVHKNWLMEQAAFDAFYPILDKGKVDVLFCGHIHYYLRNLPYGELATPVGAPPWAKTTAPLLTPALPFADAVTGTIDHASVSGVNSSIYTNPKYMVNIVTGASGDKEGETPCVVDILPPAVTCDTDFGYGLFSAINHTHATWSFTSIATDWPWSTTNYTDSLTIIQYNH